LSLPTQIRASVFDADIGDILLKSGEELVKKLAVRRNELITPISMPIWSSSISRLIGVMVSLVPDSLGVAGF
jgi:hypothetical protein